MTKLVGTVKAGDKQYPVYLVEHEAPFKGSRTRKLGTAPLVPNWCTEKCQYSGYDGDIVYPQDGECSCGVYKHHVHRVICGHITQVG